MPTHFHYCSAGFLDELRAYAMKLHTREQAPREGKAEPSKAQQQVRSLGPHDDPPYVHLLLPTAPNCNKDTALHDPMTTECAGLVALYYT